MIPSRRHIGGFLWKKPRTSVRSGAETRTRMPGENSGLAYRAEGLTLRLSVKCSVLGSPCGHAH